MSSSKFQFNEEWSVPHLFYQWYQLSSCTWHLFYLRCVLCRMLRLAWLNWIVFTAGSDGTVHFWDRDARMRLKSAYPFVTRASPLPCSFPFFLSFILDVHPEPPFFLTYIPGFNRASGPIVCSAFNGTGSIFAYAVSYDWHKGFSGMTSKQPNKIMVHVVKDEDVRKRATKS